MHYVLFAIASYQFPSIPSNSWWASTVESIDSVSACSVVEAWMALTLVYICNENDHNSLRLTLATIRPFQVGLNPDYLKLATNWLA